MPPSTRRQRKLRFGLPRPTVAFAFLCPMMALVATPDQLGKSGGLGVINMRERVLQLHGTFEFDSEPGARDHGESGNSFSARVVECTQRIAG